jgi:hypothetical protein
MSGSETDSDVVAELGRSHEAFNSLDLDIASTNLPTQVAYPFGLVVCRAPTRSALLSACLGFTCYTLTVSVVAVVS